MFCFRSGRDTFFSFCLEDGHRGDSGAWVHGGRGQTHDHNVLLLRKGLRHCFGQRQRQERPFLCWPHDAQSSTGKCYGSIPATLLQSRIHNLVCKNCKVRQKKNILEICKQFLCLRYRTRLFTKWNSFFFLQTQDRKMVASEKTGRVHRNQCSHPSAICGTKLLGRDRVWRLCSNGESGIPHTQIWPIWSYGAQALLENNKRK